MSVNVPSFSHDFQPGAIHFGRGCVAGIGDRIETQGYERVLVVCGRNVGANRDLMDPLEAALAGFDVELFDETTPEKHLETVYDGVDRLRETDADVIVGVGAGSSLDVARFMRLLDGRYRPFDDLIAEIETEGTPAVPDRDDDLVPVYAVPTTFAGADLSVAAAITHPTSDGGRVETIPVDKNLMPSNLFYDPALYETTPTDILAGSAFNGFDKALETVYSTFANPVTDATAVRALQYLRDALPNLRSDDPAVIDRAVVGMLLAQFGVSMPAQYKCNVVHAFGHGLRNEFGVQQGIAHATMAPHVLKSLFNQVDGRRDVLAEGLVTGASADEDPAAAVVAAVQDIRDGLDLPSRLRNLDGTSPDGLRNAAVLTHEDVFMSLGPDAFDPSIDDIEGILEQAW